MAAPLLQCTKEQHAVVRFLWSEGVKTAEIHRRLLLQHGNSCLAQRKVYEWVELFRNGRTSVGDEHRPGRPQTSTNRNDENVEELIWADRRVTVDLIADKLEISHSSVHTIIHKNLQFKNLHQMDAKSINEWTQEKSRGGVHLATGMVSKGRWESFKAYSNRRWKVGSPFWTWEYTAKHKLEASFFSNDKVQGSSHAYTALGLGRAYTWNITRRKLKEWIVNATVPF